jgi:hypothetical protein
VIKWQLVGFDDFCGDKTTPFGGQKQTKNHLKKAGNCFDVMVL